MPEAEAPAAEAGGWDVWSIGKNIAIFVGIQLAVKQFTGGGGQKAAPATPDTASPGGSDPAAWSHVPINVSPLWPADQNVDVSLYVSESVVLPPLGAMPAGSLILEEKDFSFGGKDTREITTSISVPKVVQNNGTLWAHIFVGKTGAELDPASPSYDPSAAYRMLRPLTQYLAKKKVVKTRNLLESKDEAEAEEEEVETEASIASYYHSNFTLSFVGNAGPTSYAGLHPATRQFYTLEATGARDESGKNGWFYPVLYHNTFWQMKKDMVELNSTIPYETLDMNVRVSTLAHWQFSVMASMDEGMKETARKAARGESSPGGGDGSEMEMIKEVMLDSNIYLLGTTVVVSILHMIFELLAFKSDVGHWRKKKDNVGVSVRTILSNVFMQLVIFLYLLDNNENTSWMILFGQGMGIAVEAWKITKTANVRVREPGTDSIFHGYLPYVVVLEDKHKLSETEEKTEEYDKIAFKYMGIVAVPLLLAYAAYSLMYETHKSWYSFIIATLVGSVYAYGFLMMIPSLYINYRLKSVAHMPGRAMAYKFLNTFIDDLFAFTIKMPVLHRLATLRDDVIFFVYIYQTWAYKVDKTRVNEFGQGGDDEPVEEKVAGKPLAAQPDAKVGGEEALKEAKKAEKKIDEVMGASGSQKGSAKQRRRG